MSRFRPYNPDQAYLLPPNTKDVLGEDHLVFFVHRVVERLDLLDFERAYSEEGGELYAPALMLKVWLYAYALGITSARRLEQRIGEDLAFRYLAGGEKPDNWALSAFRRRHGRALNDVFTQVLEMARRLGMGRLGHVAIDSSRVKAAASRERMDSEERLRRERARLRRQIRGWQQACNAEEPDENAGMQLRIAEWESAATNSAAPGAVAQKRAAANIAPRWGCPVSPHPGRMGVGVFDGDCGHRRPHHRGAASHAAQQRQ
jgi:transposase